MPNCAQRQWQHEYQNSDEYQHARRARARDTIRARGYQEGCLPKCVLHRGAGSAAKIWRKSPEQMLSSSAFLRFAGQPPLRPRSRNVANYNDICGKRRALRSSPIADSCLDRPRDQKMVRAQARVTKCAKINWNRLRIAEQERRMQHQQRIKRQHDRLRTDRCAPGELKRTRPKCHKQYHHPRGSAT